MLRLSEWFVTPTDLMLVAASNAADAIASASQCTFDVLLTDGMMDPMNGIRIALAILEIRVILLSGSDRATPILVAAPRQLTLFRGTRCPGK